MPACTTRTLREVHVSDQPDNLVVEPRRGVRATQAEHTDVPARLDRRVPAIECNITRIRRENAGDAETALATIMDHGERLGRLEQTVREQPRRRAVASCDRDDTRRSLTSEDRQPRDRSGPLRAIAGATSSRRPRYRE